MKALMLLFTREIKELESKSQQCVQICLNFRLLLFTREIKELESKSQL